MVEKTTRDENCTSLEYPVTKMKIPLVNKRSRSLKALVVFFLLLGGLYLVWFLLEDQPQQEVHPKTFKFKAPVEQRAYDHFPIWNHDGYKGIHLPTDLRRKVVETWLTNRHKRELEVPDERYIHYDNALEDLADRKQRGISPVYVYHFERNHPDLAAEIRAWLKVELEHWSGVKDLESTAMYGIREYTDGAVLEYHVDRWDTHVLSGIIHVGSISPRSDWPITVYNRNTQPINVSGLGGPTAILYESATLVHGRTTPYRGEIYANMFIHFRPVGWLDVVKKIPQFKS
eukprot:TRINITY_DN2273_c0_g4_i4.p1 TRINITY_DN2273_c0_g4~~TRINITY_DN2273_c0_g4_i4.p1  ORF type:complete len:287 (+),score=38.80 TRINITY_DN2273_c0_g4_i4:165-1025(+)